jgi:hypothetical protein
MVTDLYPEAIKWLPGRRYNGGSPSYDLLAICQLSPAIQMSLSALNLRLEQPGYRKGWEDV